MLDQLHFMYDRKTKGAVKLALNPSLEAPCHT
jgi:hypothetical protein